MTLVSLAYLLSLFAKTSGLTLPFVLLLLDYWPLGRFGSPPEFRLKTFGRLALEKVPLFVLMMVFLVVTSGSATHSLGANEQISIATRAQDAIVNYALYLGKFFVPVGLSPLYPYVGGSWSVAAVAGSFTVLAAITAGAWILRRRAPFIAVGWLWFLGVMAPLCGIIIVGSHSRADRYMYIPIIGIAIAVTWGIAALASRAKLPAATVRIAAFAAIVGFAVAGWQQIPNWEDEKALAATMLRAHDWNPMGHYLMGKALEAEGDVGGAIRHYQEMLKRVPTDPGGHVAIGNTQYRLGAYEQATFWYAKAAELSPTETRAYYGLGLVAAKTGDTEKARAFFRQCLQIDPGYYLAHRALAEMDAGATPADLP